MSIEKVRKLSYLLEVLVDNNLIFKYATITSLDDPDKVGRMQVRVLPYMKDVKEELLPWYYPFFAHSKDTPKFEPYSVGTNVNVLCSESYKNGYVVSKDYLTGLFDFDTPSGTLGGVSELGDTSYENLRFSVFENGNISFYNVDSGEHGLYHNSGSYTLFDTDGNIIVNSKSGKVKVYNDITDLKTIVEDLRQVVENIITPNNLVGNSGAPVIYTPVGADLPQVQVVIKQAIDDLFLD